MQFICAESKATAAPICFMLLLEHIWDRCNHATWGSMKEFRNVNMLNYSHMQIWCACLKHTGTAYGTYALAYVPYVVCIWTGNGELCCTGNPTFLPLRVTDLTRGFSSLQLFFTYCLIQQIQKSAHLMPGFCGVKKSSLKSSSAVLVGLSLHLLLPDIVCKELTKYQRDVFVERYQTKERCNKTKN